MACSHLNADARNKIKSLEEEKGQYESFKGDAESVKSGIESYATFMKNLGSQLAEVKPKGVAYDEGQCATYSSSLTSLASDIGTMIGEAGRAIEEIDEEIELQKGIISSSKICYNCQRAAAEAAAASSGQKRSGGGPKLNPTAVAMDR